MALDGIVLLIDDEPEILRLNKERLLKEGIQSICASSAEQAELALEHDTDHRIKLIVADYWLESIRDLDVQKALVAEHTEQSRFKTIARFTRNARQRRPDLPIVILTGQDSVLFDKLNVDKVLIYDLLLHKKDRLTSALLVEIVTHFLENRSFEIFSRYKYHRDERGDQVEIKILSKVYSSLSVTITNSGVISFEGSHFLGEGRLKDVITHLGDMILMALKVADLAKIPNLSEGFRSLGFDKSRPSDKIIAALMGMTRQTVQRQKSRINQDDLILETSGAMKVRP